MARSLLGFVLVAALAGSAAEDRPARSPPAAATAPSKPAAAHVPRAPAAPPRAPAAAAAAQPAPASDKRARRPRPDDVDLPDPPAARAAAASSTARPALREQAPRTGCQDMCGKCAEGFVCSAYEARRPGLADQGTTPAGPQPGRCECRPAGP